MSSLYRARVETTTHSDYVGVRCDGCGKEHVEPSALTHSTAMLITTPDEWIRVEGHSSKVRSKDLCGDCGAHVHRYIEALATAAKETK